MTGGSKHRRPTKASVGSQGPAAIGVSALTKRFGRVTALDGLDLTVATGQVHGFLGPNGAGKSTTIRVLLGLLQRSAGEVEVLGGDPWTEAADLHRRLAYIPGEVNLWPNLSGGEVIDLLGRLRGGLDQKRRASLIEQFQLDPTKRCGTYSKGNRQKVAIVAALASDVELYIFDEPTSGLDPLMESTFQEEVRRLKSAGKTVLLSSHILSEAEALCDDVTIIRDGKAVESGSLADMRHLTRMSITVDTLEPVDGLDQIVGVHSVRSNGTHAEFNVEADALDAVLRELTTHGVRQLVSNPPSLEQIFLRHYETARPVSEESVEETA